MSILQALFGGLGFRRDSSSVTQIPDGDNQARTSQADGERFILARGDTTVVDGAPVLTIDNDRVRFDNRGTAETTGDTSTVNILGDDARVQNFSSGEISAGQTAVSVSGDDASIINRGSIDGGVNGVNFVNGGESSGQLVNHGVVSSDSRAVNIGGSDIEIENFGSILGIGNQRNGTIYSDATAEDYSILNGRRGRIDAGAGNDGAGVALQTGDVANDTVNADITNRGTIAGRGQAAPDVGTAGDGIRVFAGAENPTFQGDITNHGTITSESNQGPVSAIRIANGVNFDGTIENGFRGLIDGANNGVYFGTGNHDATVNNFGRIQSDSRAVNIDGSAVDLNNFGRILGTGDQRNGTVYSDATANDYSIFNGRRGRIDAGEGNDGAGVALQTGDVANDTVNADIANSGTITGRGQAAPNVGTAGDGVRIFAGAENPTFQGDITNHGTITSESNQGPVSAIRIANGVNFDGTIENGFRGLIDGTNNGLYFGTGNHDATVNNFGRIQSDSRAVNIDGSGVELNNFGRILGTGDQRNGTVYSDATADEFSVVNHRRGIIDAGRGNDGAAVSLQTGDEDGDTVIASVTNSGLIVGRGDGDGNLTGDGIRLFSGISDGATTFQGDIVNNGRILSEDAAGIRLSADVALDGTIQNHGLISGKVGIDATENDTGVSVVNTGSIRGDVLLGSGNDVFDGSNGRVFGDINGGGGNDTLTGSRNRDTFVFESNTGSDTVTDFVFANETLDVGDFFASQSDALAAARQDGGDTVIDLDVSNGDQVRLVGVNVNDLDTDNFIV